ncbi:MAG: chemotaxis protein CheW, partial [Thermoanaerobaculia bacterium]
MKQLRLITFSVGSETFALDIMAVQQIVPYTGSTPVPTAPSFVEGIIVLRNEVVPIIDLRDRLYPTLDDRYELPLVLIAHTSAGLIGVKVDEVRRIVTVSSDAVLLPPAVVRGIRGDFLIGIIEQSGELLLLLDVDSVLSGE